MPDPTDPSATDSASKPKQADEVVTGCDPDATRPAPRSGIAPPTPFGPPATPGEVGTLGPYRVVRQLGTGGMGAVYLAVDTRLARKVALKVMLPEYAANAASRRRFLREARVSARVVHDNVVMVFEADERDGVPYIAMQLLQGLRLDEYLKKNRLPLQHLLRIARETALGLSAAHALGLIHRDIKPANLWLEAPNGHVKVLDFGLAKPVQTESEVTQSGVVLGTPSYMSPEQARGEKVDCRADLFSLGAVMYRLCTGRSPFSGPTVMAVLTALGTQEPTPVRELNPEVPKPLAALIHQLLAKDPADRPQTATEVANHLRDIAQQLTQSRVTLATVGPDEDYSEQSEVTESTETDVPRSWVLRNKVEVAGVVLSFVVLVLAIVLVAHSGKSEPEKVNKPPANPDPVVMLPVRTNPAPPTPEPKVEPKVDPKVDPVAIDNLRRALVDKWKVTSAPGFTAAPALEKQNRYFFIRFDADGTVTLGIDATDPIERLQLAKDPKMRAEAKFRVISGTQIEFYEVSPAFQGVSLSKDERITVEVKGNNLTLKDKNGAIQLLRHRPR